jgi:hypothetical protein
VLAGLLAGQELADLLRGNVCEGDHSEPIVAIGVAMFVGRRCPVLKS